MNYTDYVVFIHLNSYFLLLISKKEYIYILSSAKMGKTKT